MKRASRRGVVLGLLALGGLLVAGCDLQEEAGRPHTPIQNKYQDGSAGAASELDGRREGLNMPDWQNHPTMGQDEENEKARSGEASVLEPQTPAIPAPEEDYQVADDIQAPRGGERTPRVEPIPGQPADEQAIGGSGGAGQQPDAGTPDAGTRR